MKKILNVMSHIEKINVAVFAVLGVMSVCFLANFTVGISDLDFVSKRWMSWLITVTIVCAFSTGTIWGVVRYRFYLLHDRRQFDLSQRTMRWLLLNYVDGVLEEYIPDQVCECTGLVNALGTASDSEQGLDSHSSLRVNNHVELDEREMLVSAIRNMSFFINDVMDRTRQIEITLKPLREAIHKGDRALAALQSSIDIVAAHQQRAQRVLKELNEEKNNSSIVEPTEPGGASSADILPAAL